MTQAHKVNIMGSKPGTKKSTALIWAVVLIAIASIVTLGYVTIQSLSVGSGSNGNIPSNTVTTDGTTYAGLTCPDTKRTVDFIVEDENAGSTTQLSGTIHVYDNTGV